MKAFTSVLFTTVAAIKIQLHQEIELESLRDLDLNDVSCGDFLVAMQINIALPIEDDQEDRIKGMISEQREDVDDIFNTIMDKKEQCSNDIQGISPAEVAGWDCDEFVEAGKELGFLNPENKEWDEIFNPP